MCEKKTSYHHMDLRNSLIEKGIELVNEDGVAAFSLRKAAAACGVSHAAPYSHFQNKEELLDAMQQHITDRFSERLEQTRREYEGSVELLKHMGIAYVAFFAENPPYFSFLYSHSNMKIDLTLSIPDEENYKPYIIYKNAALPFLEQIGCPQEKRCDAVIALWAFVHGIASLAAMENILYDGNWKEKVADFMELFGPSFMAGPASERGSL